MKYIFIFIVTASISACYSRQPEKTGLEGKPLPSFKILLTDSSTYADTKDISGGSPIVLYYFGPHCPYCRAQLEEIIKEIDKLRNIQFYMFTTWPFEDMKIFYNHYQLNKYTNITVGIDYNNFFGNYYKVAGVPYTAIYGRDKKLIEAFIGNVSVKQIKQVIYN